MRTSELRDVKTEVCGPGEFILQVSTASTSPPGSDWFAAHKAPIRDALARFGAVFFRGFLADSRQFEASIDALAGDPLDYVGGVSPRSSVHGSVYTATDAPPPLAIVQHHEMSYHSFTPRFICFYCDTPATEGGATPLADGRRLFRTLQAAAPSVVEKLEKEGTLFVRNYHDGNFKGWREAWNTSDKGELEKMLRKAGTEWEWVTGDWLRTRHRLPAIVRDPRSGGRVLFSCVHLWHRWYVRQMNAATGTPMPDDVSKQPYATFFGDGTDIPEGFIELMHETFKAQTVAIPYRRTDFTIVSNLISTHGREAYVPPRKVYATLRERVYLSDALFCQPHEGAPV